MRKVFLFPVLEIKVLKKVYESKYSPKIVYIYLFLEVPKFVTTLFWCEVSTDILFPGCFVCLGLVVISADLLRKTSQKQSGETSTTWYSSLFIIIICILQRFTQCYKIRKKSHKYLADYLPQRLNSIYFGKIDFEYKVYLTKLNFESR